MFRGLIASKKRVPHTRHEPLTSSHLQTDLAVRCLVISSNYSYITTSVGMADTVLSTARIRASQVPSSPQIEMSTAMDLTPRSKIKAMLAELDSDTESDTQAPSKSGRSALPVQTVESTTARHHQQTLSDANGEEEDSDVPKARRGTFASRMQELESSPENDSDNISDGNAYDRVRRRLLSGPLRETSSNLERTASEEVSDRTATANKSPKSRYSASSPTADSGSSENTRKMGSRSPINSRHDSSSLFVSPDKPRPDAESEHGMGGSDSDELVAIGQLKIADRLQALASRRREERLAKEKKAGRITEDESSPEPAKSSGPRSRQLQFTLEDESDGDIEASRKMTQRARTSRRASKKAIDEMNKETQRMSRNMQLTHEARTRTKFTTEALFARFNFRQAIPPATTHKEELHASSSSANPSSDVEASGHYETPPSSPPSLSNTPPEKRQTLSIVPAEVLYVPSMPPPIQDDEELLSLDNLLSQKNPQPEALHVFKAALHSNGTEAPQTKRASVRRLAKSAGRLSATNLPSDDDLEIVGLQQTSRLAIFDNLPAVEGRDSNSMHALRALAHISDARKERGRGRDSMTASELQSSLHHRARQQALRDRDEKIQRLRERGVLVQTAEEKEQEQMQLESMLERARKEAQELAKKEKEDAKREGKEGGSLPDSDEDEDYQASDEEEEAQLSGSDEEIDAAENEENELGSEEEDDDELGGDSAAGQNENSFFEREAADDGEEEENEDDPTRNEENSEDNNEASFLAMVAPRKRLQKRRIVDSDDEGELKGDITEAIINSIVAEPATPAAPKTPATTKPDAFGFSSRKPAPLGLSQVFAGTMAEDQTQEPETSSVPGGGNQDALAFLRTTPSQGLPNFEDSLALQSPQTVVQDSQIDATPRRNSLQSPLIRMPNVDFQTPGPNCHTQISELPELTQDDGFQVRDSQPPLPADSYATVDTVLLDDDLEQPIIPRKGRLQRRSEAVSLHTESEDVVQHSDGEEEPGPSVTPDVFQMMREARAKAAATDNFNKKQSKAKEMVEEQAEESEDEYAGLGGADDDESQGELDEETRRMIDDQGNEKTDERDIAAYYAEKARVDDEKGIEKLYKDVINGGLRRKRGAEHDLWDSDDEDEAAARRRAAKQREFAKMRKALLADEKIGKIAENPKQAAFLQAIEDHDEGDDLDFLDKPEESFTSTVPDSQREQSRAQPLSTISGNSAGMKRSRAEYGDPVPDSQEAENMPAPANPRRSKIAKVTRPTSLADIRNTLSEIIGEPESILESQRIGSESEHSDNEAPDYGQRGGRSHSIDSDDDELYGQRSGSLPSPPPESSRPNPRRSQPTAARSTVVNRMALKKQSSAFSLTRSGYSQSRLAFHNPSTSFTSKVPSLLRRATKSGSLDSQSSTSAGSASDAGIGGLGGKDAVKRGGTAKSSVNYYVRDMERKAKVEKVERDRSERRAKVGKMRREVLKGKEGGRGSGLGGLVGGGFD